MNLIFLQRLCVKFEPSKNQSTAPNSIPINAIQIAMYNYQIYSNYEQIEEKDFYHQKFSNSIWRKIINSVNGWRKN